MKIAIHTADLDCDRIDGTRVYILNVLKYLGKLAPDDSFFLYHRKKYNTHLEPPKFENYTVVQKSAPFLWTQLCFGLQMLIKRPDAIWMPMHNIPFLLPSRCRAVVTIHDLAFLKFPQFFPKKDLMKLKILARLAIEESTHIIAISNATKKDILHYFPHIKEKKISVVYHGFDRALFENIVSEEDAGHILAAHGLEKKKYLLYVGALQPRKDLVTLVKAFQLIKAYFPDLKLLLIGEKAWMWEDLMEHIEVCKYKKDIILTGAMPFSKLPAFYQNAAVFVFPELYAGFGIPLLEAFASQTPVVCARNSSLEEIGEGAATFFETGSPEDLSQQLVRVLSDESYRKDMVAKGAERVKDFSWEKCAKETLECIKGSQTAD